MKRQNPIATELEAITKDIQALEKDLDTKHTGLPGKDTKKEITAIHDRQWERT